MADHVYVKTPDAFCVGGGGNPAAAWDKWIRKFDIFLQATGASKKEDVVKIGLLLNHIGDEGLEIHANFVFLPQRPDPANPAANLPAEKKDSCDTVVGKFNSFFHRRDPQLMLREQYWYHLHRETGQTFDSWVRAVKEKAAACKFDNVDMMVRDKLVFSCREDTAKMKLYDLGPTLTLQKTQEVLYMRELTRKELESSKTSTVNTLRQRGGHQQQRGYKGQHNGPGQQRTSGGGQPQGPPKQRSDVQSPKCGYCNNQHPRGKKNCPAAKTHCRKCNKLGHYAIVCRSVPAIQEVIREGYDDPEPYESGFIIGGVHDRSASSRDQGWHIKLKVGSHELTWCIDTGAQVSVMPDHIFKPAFGTLHSSDSTLLGPGDQPLDVKGYVDLNLILGHTCVRERVYVAKASKLLLGAPAIRKLGLIRNIPGAFTIKAIRSMATGEQPQ